MIHNSTTLNTIMTKFISLFCITLMAVAVSSATQQTNGGPGTGTDVVGGHVVGVDSKPEAHAIKRDEEPESEAHAIKRGEEPESVKRDSIKRGSTKRDAIKRGSVKRDSIKRGSTKRDVIKRGSIKRDAIKRGSIKRGGI
ncbi:predicted protein [Lichtheimia corymbifera JMRC:FSU:9682]|uniref:Uncharacterized protein n=1 Tax=Lichtheimia corymbifera JMRC:FSU:9682 TaxID=1263082 RepID=A0A068SD97_9FUNG|nr:predicted protein [Lichtheimia corymbifera JMRC:FSU:9682]